VNAILISYAWRWAAKSEEDLCAVQSDMSSIAYGHPPPGLSSSALLPKLLQISNGAAYLRSVCRFVSPPETYIVVTARLDLFAL
jgi:hypothetical protein